MRVLFLLIVLANLWAYALGQGWLGTPPDDEGRNAPRLTQELNGENVAIVKR